MHASFRSRISSCLKCFFQLMAGVGRLGESKLFFAALRFLLALQALSAASEACEQEPCHVADLQEEDGSASA